MAEVLRKIGRALMCEVFPATLRLAPEMFEKWRATSGALYVSDIEGFDEQTEMRHLRIVKGSVESAGGEYCHISSLGKPYLPPWGPWLFEAYFCEWQKLLTLSANRIVVCHGDGAAYLSQFIKMPESNSSLLNWSSLILVAPSSDTDFEALASFSDWSAAIYIRDEPLSHPTIQCLSSIQSVRMVKNSRQAESQLNAWMARALIR
jgi:hypothetical protein